MLSETEFNELHEFVTNLENSFDWCDEDECLKNNIIKCITCDRRQAKVSIANIRKIIGEDIYDKNGNKIN